MRELMLGMIAVGLTAGLMVGRTTERFRRATKDHNTAVAAVPKAHKIMVAERKRVVVTVVLVALAMIVVFLSAVSIGD